MKADGVTAEQVTPELCLAYLNEVTRRRQKIENILLTNPEAKRLFNFRVLSDCRAQ